ncbi:MAG: DUF2514 domain-containing protein [Comamonas sp.]
MNIWLRIALWAALVLGLVWVFNAWQQHLVAKGDAVGAGRVHAEWKAADNTRLRLEKAAQAKAAAARLLAEQKARDQELSRQKTAERIAHETAQREDSLRTAVARADTRNRSLLNTIDQLNKRQPASSGVDMPNSAAQSQTAACIGEAATARQLLGRCSERYAGVAADAEQLRSQVIGLQDWILSGEPQEGQ